MCIWNFFLLLTDCILETLVQISLSRQKDSGHFQLKCTAWRTEGGSLHTCADELCNWTCRQVYWLCLSTFQVRNISSWYQKTWRRWFELKKKNSSEQMDLNFSILKGKGLWLKIKDQLHVIETEGARELSCRCYLTLNSVSKCCSCKSKIGFCT